MAPANVLDVSLAENAGYLTIVATGSPLLDDTALNHTLQGSAADVFVTTNDNYTKLGAWSPYAFYPLQDPTRWAALIGDVPKDKIGETATEFYDRGYGIVHMHSSHDYSVEPADLQDVLTRVTQQKDGTAIRRLQEDRRLSTPAPTFRWSCDDRS